MGSMHIYQVPFTISNSKFQSLKGLVDTVQEVIITHILINDHITIVAVTGVFLLMMLENGATVS